MNAETYQRLTLAHREATAGHRDGTPTAYYLEFLTTPYNARGASLILAEPSSTTPLPVPAVGETVTLHGWDLTVTGTDRTEYGYAGGMLFVRSAVVVEEPSSAAAAEG